MLLDLDDTLIAEQPTVEATLADVCAIARDRFGVAPAALADSLRRRARELWHGFRAYPYCDRIGIGSTEGLWGRFTGDDPNLQALAAWAPTYRLTAWTRALADHGIDDPGFARGMETAYRRERVRRHIVFDDVEPTLDALRGKHDLAMVTNGAPDVQRAKLDATGLERYFTAVIISGEAGVGKPEGRIFHKALACVAAGPERAIMVGDSQRRDVAGAQQAGLKGIWIRRFGQAPDPGVQPDAVIETLAELGEALATLGM